VTSAVLVNDPELTTVTVPVPVSVCHPCADPPEFMPQTWLAVPLVLISTAALAVQVVQVPVRLVMTPDVGVPSNGVTSVGDVANTMLPVPVAPAGVTPPMLIAVPNVCFPDHVLALVRLSDATTEPVVGDTVSVLSEFDTDDTAPPPEPHADPVSASNPSVPENSTQ
jgi:hypothetical protein